MQRKIVADSSADTLEVPGMDFASVPLKVIAGTRTYVDDASTDPAQMIEELHSFKGKMGTACPSIYDWQEAFGEAEEIFCITISSALSGSNNAAQIAAKDYMTAHPERRVYVVDSLSTGPEMMLIIEKLAELIGRELPFEDICREIEAYQKTTRIIFCLQSLRNLAAGGRVSPAVAALIGMLGIRVVGRGSEVGEIEPIAKCRGDRKALAEIVVKMKEMGYRGGRVIIDHCLNESLASSFRELLRGMWADADIILRPTRALCSYYAEAGGLIIGFETAWAGA